MKLLIITLLLVGCVKPPAPEPVYEIKVWHMDLLSKIKTSREPDDIYLARTRPVTGWRNRLTFYDEHWGEVLITGNTRFECVQIDTIYPDDPRHSQYRPDKGDKGDK